MLQRKPPLRPHFKDKTDWATSLSFVVGGLVEHISTCKATVGMPASTLAAVLLTWKTYKSYAPSLWFAQEKYIPLVVMADDVVSAFRE